MLNIYEMLIKRSRSVEPPAPAIPTDYAFYAPFTEDLNDISQYERTLTCSGTAPTFTTVDGVECMSLPSGSYISTDDMSGITLGDHSKAICLWAKIANTFSSGNYPMMMTLGYYNVNHGCLHLMYGHNSKWYAATWGGDSTFTSEYNINTVWNCFIINYDASTSTYDVYLNGQLLSNSVKANIMNITSNAGIMLAGVKGGGSSFTMPVTTYYRDVLIYDRALTSSEIEAISSMVDITYTITAQDLSCSFYQKNESFGIQYTSPAGTPTFEIIEGTLPSTITFNTSTGQFSGKGLTDADHTYNLVVRLTAPHSTPATCNVTIHTYMTARISITGKTFTFYTDGSESGSFTYTSDESVTFAIESGYSLPSGITMSGNTFYSDGTTTDGSYSVKIRGTSTHNQTGVTATMYFNVNANAITVTTTEMKFYASKGVTSKQVAYTTSHFPVTPVYTLTGTLPSGITFDSSTGTFTSDGTQSSEETASVSVSVASSTGLSTAGTGTISIQVYTTAPAIPDDYILYAPLKTNYVPEVGTFVDVTSNWTFATAPDGTQAAYNSDPTQRDGALAGFKYTGSVSSTDSLTCSIWCYCTRAFNTTPPDWVCPIGVGNKSGNGVAFEWGYKGNFEVPWISGWNTSDTTIRPTNDAWHHVLFTYERGGYFNLYVDGSLIWTSSTTKSISIGSNNMYVGTRYNDGRPWVGYLRNAIIYNRVLTMDEIESIYNDGIDPAPAPQPTSYLPRRGTDTTMTSTGILYKTATHYFIENGFLYNITGRTAGSAVKVGTSDKWTSCTEYIETTDTADYDTFAYGICDGTLYKLSLGGVATSMNKTCDLVSGHYVKYKSINNNEWFGLGNCSDGLYRLGTSATKINSKHDWVELSGLLYNYNSSNYDGAYGIDSTGTLYRIAYDGTLTQVATSIDHVTGVYRNGSNMGNWGSQLMTGDHSHTNHVLYISNGSLYYTLNAGAISSGTLIDSTGTWTAVYGIAFSTAQGYGIRDGKVCSITTSGYTATAHDALAVGYYGWYVASDGLVYNEQGQRLTATTY